MISINFENPITWSSIVDFVNPSKLQIKIASVVGYIFITLGFLTISLYITNAKFVAVPILSCILTPKFIIAASGLMVLGSLIGLFASEARLNELRRDMKQNKQEIKQLNQAQVLLNVLKTEREHQDRYKVSLDEGSA